MHYKFRWYYASVISVTIILFGLFNIQIKIRAIKHLARQEQLLKINLTQLQKISKNGKIKTKQVHQLLNDNELTRKFLTAIETIAHQNSVNLVSITMQSERAWRVFVKGSFDNLFHFIFKLLQQDNTVLIKEISFASNSQFIPGSRAFARDGALKMNLFLSRLEKKEYTNNELSLVNPFCSEDKLLSFHQLAHSVSLEQIKMIGYFAQGQQLEALFATPNGSVISLEAGSLLGKEGALIKKIHSNYVLLSLRNQQPYIIRMSHKNR